jgi:hypothetical protein
MKKRRIQGGNPSGVFSEIDKELNALSETAWDVSGWKDYCDFGFGDV